MIAKIIAWGRDRAEAMARLRVALRETTVVVKGGTTTKSFLLELLDHPEVINGDRRHRVAGPGRADRQASVAQHADAALLFVAVDVYDDRGDAGARRRSCAPPAAAGPGQPRRRPRGRARLPGSDLHASTSRRSAPSRYRIEVGGRGGRGRARPDQPFESRLDVGGRRHPHRRVHGTGRYLVEVDSVSHRVSRDEGGDRPLARAGGGGRGAGRPPATTSRPATP